MRPRASTSKLAYRTDRASREQLDRGYGIEVLARTRDGELLAVFPDRWRLNGIRRELPELTLEPLAATTS